jgi:hypothetical protein
MTLVLGQTKKALGSSQGRGEFAMDSRATDPGRLRKEQQEVPKQQSDSHGLPEQSSKLGSV